MQGQQVAQTADGQTIVYQPVNADGTVLQQGKLLGSSPLLVFIIYIFLMFLVSHQVLVEYILSYFSYFCPV